MELKTRKSDEMDKLFEEQARHMGVLFNSPTTRGNDAAKEQHHFPITHLISIGSGQHPRLDIKDILIRQLEEISQYMKNNYEMFGIFAVYGVVERKLTQDAQNPITVRPNFNAHCFIHHKEKASDYFRMKLRNNIDIHCKVTSFDKEYPWRQYAYITKDEHNIVYKIEPFFHNPLDINKNPIYKDTFDQKYYDEKLEIFWSKYPESRMKMFDEDEKNVKKSTDHLYPRYMACLYMTNFIRHYRLTFDEEYCILANGTKITYQHFGILFKKHPLTRDLYNQRPKAFDKIFNYVEIKNLGLF